MPSFKVMSPIKANRRRYEIGQVAEVVDSDAKPLVEKGYLTPCESPKTPVGGPTGKKAAQEVIAAIAEAADEAAVKALIEGEDRKSVLVAAEKRIADIKAGK